jgi:hypothetical protein
VIFVQLILNNFGDNHFSPLVIGEKQWREKEEERIKKACTLFLKKCIQLVLMVQNYNKKLVYSS